MKKFFTLVSLTLLSTAIFGQSFFPDKEEEVKDNFIQEITIYPNPTSNGNFALSLEMEFDKEITVKLFNLIGKEILVKNLQLFQGLNEESFTLNGKPKGVYILEISSGDKKEIRRISFI